MSWFSNRTIVVPIDLSEFSMQACRAAAEMVEDRKFLRIVHVLPILEPAEPGMIWTAIDDVSRLDQAKVSLMQFLTTHGFGDLSIDIRLGDPGNEITYFAEEINADLIVIPSHGRGMLQRILLGSTTDRVVHLAPCPVLVLKPKKS